MTRIPDARTEADLARLDIYLSQPPSVVADRALENMISLRDDPRLTLCRRCNGRSMVHSSGHWWAESYFIDCPACGGRGLWWRKWWHPLIGVRLPLPHKDR